MVGRTISSVQVNHPRNGGFTKFQSAFVRANVTGTPWSDSRALEVARRLAAQGLAEYVPGISGGYTLTSRGREVLEAIGDETFGPAQPSPAVPVVQKGDTIVVITDAGTPRRFTRQMASALS